MSTAVVQILANKCLVEKTTRWPVPVTNPSSHNKLILINLPKSSKKLQVLIKPNHYSPGRVIN